MRDDFSLKLRCSMRPGWAGKGLESAEKETEKEAEDEDRDLLAAHVDDGVLAVGVLVEQPGLKVTLVLNHGHIVHT